MKRLWLFLPAIAVFCSGFKFIEPPRKWDETEMPIEVFVGDTSPPGLTEEETLELIERAGNNWEDVECSPLRLDYTGAIANEPSFGRDDRTQITFNGSLETGVLAAAVTHANYGEVLTYNGNSFAKTVAYNIIFNTGPTWGTPEYIASPSCFGRTSFLGVTTHETGHGLGLGHSCDDGEPCPDPIKRTATMYWSVGQCNDGQDIPNEDDRAGINAIYGVAVDFDVDGIEGGTTVGEVPLTVVVSVPEEFQTPRFTGFEWNFGDGSDLEFREAGHEDLDGLEHTYSSEGQFTITLTAFGDDESCGGEFETFKREVGAALACGAPSPAGESVNEGDFVVQMVNTSPLGAFGCTTEYEWILDGDAGSSLSTYEPTYVFESAGEHTVTLRAAGPGGEATAEIDIVAKQASDAGCNSSVVGTGSAGLFGLLFLGLLGLIRRP